MNTLCMVTREELSWDECLSCAAHGKNECGWDYALLRAIKAHGERERDGYHVTEIKACLKKAFFTRTMDSLPTYPSDRMYVFLGSMTHHLLEGSDHEIWTEVPVQITLLGHVLRGIVDAYSPTLKRIIDYKTTRSLKPGALPYGDHVEQVKIYATMLREVGLGVETAAVQYIDLSGPSKCPYCKVGTLEPGQTFTCRNCKREFTANDRLHNGATLYEIELDDTELAEVKQNLTERISTLDTALQEGTPPPGEPGWLCRYCSFRSICPEAES